MPLPAFFPGYQSGSALKHPRRLAIAVCPGCPPPTWKTSLAIPVSDRPKLFWRLAVAKTKTLAWVHGDKDSCLPLAHHSGPRGQSDLVRTHLEPIVSAEATRFLAKVLEPAQLHTHRPPSPCPSAPLPSSLLPLLPLLLTLPFPLSSRFPSYFSPPCPLPSPDFSSPSLPPTLTPSPYPSPSPHPLLALQKSHPCLRGWKVWGPLVARTEPQPPQIVEFRFKNPHPSLPDPKQPHTILGCCLDSGLHFHVQPYLQKKSRNCGGSVFFFFECIVKQEPPRSKIV